MSLFRREHDVITGETTIVDQSAYRNSDGDVIVLDSIDPAPDGYDELTQEEIESLRNGQENS